MAEFGIHPYHTAPSASADLVLVHGLMGHSTDTWTGKDKDGKNTFWPDWIKAQCPSVNIWRVDYDSSLNAWIQPAMPLDSIAGAVLSHAKDQGLGQRPIHWVGHSMGGLVIKHLLRQAREKANPDWQRVSDQTAAITFLGTPHLGSEVANWGGYFSALLSTADVFLGTGGTATGLLSTFKGWIKAAGKDKTSHVEQLRAHSRDLGSLNDSFAQWLGKAPLRGRQIEVRNYFEELPVYGTVFVVPKSFAQLANAVIDDVPVQANHFDICKPSSDQSPVFLGLLRVTQSIAGSSNAFPNLAVRSGASTTASPVAARAPHLLAEAPLARPDSVQAVGRDLTDTAWRNALRDCDSSVQRHAANQLGQSFSDAALSLDGLEEALATAIQQGDHWFKIGALKRVIQEGELPRGWEQHQFDQLATLQAMLMVRLCALAYTDLAKVADERDLCLPDDRNQMAIAVASHLIAGHGVEISLGPDGVQVANLIDLASLLDESAQAPGQQGGLTPIGKELKAYFKRTAAGGNTEQGRQFMSGYLNRRRDKARPFLIDREGRLITPELSTEARRLGMGVVSFERPDQPSAMDKDRWSDLCQALEFDVVHFGSRSDQSGTGASSSPPTSQQPDRTIQVNLNQSFNGPVCQSNVTTGSHSPIHAHNSAGAAASKSAEPVPLALAFSKLSMLLEHADTKESLNELRDLVLERESSASALRRLPKLWNELQTKSTHRPELAAEWTRLQILMAAHWPELQTFIR